MNIKVSIKAVCLIHVSISTPRIVFSLVPSSVWLLPHLMCVTRMHNAYMGQFPEDGNFGRFMSNFFKQKATVAKPMDIDDFYWFVLANYDLGMVRKSILTLLSKKTFCLLL